MKTIKRLFGLNKESRKSQGFKNSDPIGLSESTHLPPEELFIDNSSPKESREVKKVHSQLINDYLNKDYYQIGIQEGFSMHSNEAAQSRKQLIKSNFRNLINEIIEENREAIFNLSNSLIEVSDLSTELKDKLENKIEFLKAEIDDLDLQKQLSIEDEGLVMSAIHSYHQGFLSGIKSYLEMDKIINNNY
ncbi:hypothetical protein ITJ86_05110 [Winogradskyella sp. F6397]|uniref:Uncharacterized protein n=1 Tax=Winogradskyella marina TaxID=2785530 RepID=A0ABS0EFP4_9FLAO|nr:hypothetical protein [Winogradskyella marina]MBF8149263.1 hypothetical protein [Winogradskyella marina]